MLSTEQLLNEGHYGPVNPTPAQDTPMDKTPAQDISRFVGPDSVRPDLGEVLSWTDQLLDAVNALHTKSQPIIHSGISPSTVLLDSSGRIHLKTIREASETHVNYKPLEQLWDSLDHFSQRAILNRYDEEAQRWLSQPPTPASDIYSIGATVYAVLTGTQPPDALDRSIAAMEDKKDPLIAPDLLVPSIPPEISDVIMKAMAVRRDDRYYSAVILRQVFKTAAVRVRERLEAELSDDVTRSADPADAPVPLLPLVEAQTSAAAEPPAVQAPDLTDSVDVKAPFFEASPLEDVLEVPTVPVAQNPPVSDAPVAMEAARIETEPAAMPMPAESFQAAAPEADDEHEVIFSSVADAGHEASGRSKMPAIAAGVAVLLLAIGGGIYKFSSAGSVAPAAETIRQPDPVADQPQLEVRPAETAPAVEQPAPAASAETATTVQDPGHIEGTRARQTRAAAAPQPEPARKAPAPAKTQAPKKQVTVEDLINDH